VRENHRRVPVSSAVEDPTPPSQGPSELAFQGRVSLEGLSRLGAILLVIPVVWVVRWIVATPTAPLLGLRAGLHAAFRGGTTMVIMMVEYTERP
jgi:hypothetical protein